MPGPRGALALSSQGDVRRRSAWHVLVSTNHKDVGTLYCLMALIGGCVGGVLSMLMGQQLTGPMHGFIASGNVWNAVIIAHGLVMIFWFVMPALIGGMGSWFIPLMIGAPDMAFPRLNLLSFWLLAAGFVCVVLGVLLPVAQAATFSFYALYLAGFSAFLGAGNLVVTILNMRAPGLGLHKMPLFCWAVFVTALLLLLVVPVLAGAVTMLALAPGVTLSQAAAGPALFTQLFWFFGHIEAYIVVLPAFGVVCQIIATFTGRPVKGYFAVAYAMVAIGLIGFVVWAHRMFFPAWMDHDINLAALILAVPGAIPFIAWGLTLYRARIIYKTPMLWALGFIFMVLVGGVMGLVMALAGISSHYDLVVHLHYVLSMGTAFAIFAGFYYWIGKISGRAYPEFWGKLHFWTFFLGVNLTFFPMQFSAYHDWAMISAFGAFLSGVSALIFVYVLFRVFLSERTLAANYWGPGAATLEWTVPSPPPLHTFKDLPVAR